MRATTEAASDGSSGGSRTGTPPAASTAAEYWVGNRSADWSHTPHRACSRYVLKPISGAMAPPSGRCHVGTADAAVDQERVRGDEAGLVGGQEQRRVRDLRRLREPAHRDGHEPALRPLRVLGEQLSEQRRVHRPRAKRVDTNTGPRE